MGARGLLIRAAAVVLLLVCVACASEPQVVQTPAPTSTAKRAHDFTLRTFDGDTFRLSDHFGELPVVLNFWAPW